LWPGVGEGGRFGVAVSGGPDSLALLLLAHAALPGRVIAATVDHGLRPEAPTEAAQVAAVCADLGVPHETVRVEVSAGNLQAQAREARYDALCRSFGTRGAEVFATAHHADDQAETLLMRLNRGSGLGGLAGIRARRAVVGERPLGEYLLVRPLLNWRRGELADIVRAEGIEPAYDPSNDDTRFDRVQMRRALAETPWLDPLALARSAEHLQDAEDAVEAAVLDVRDRCIHRDGDTIWYHWGHPRLIEIEAVSSILVELGTEPPASAVAQMIDQLTTDRHATLGGVMAKRAWHQKNALTQIDAWRFEREPPRKS
jgi:tRNA(Ile)-lysidine synthase